MPLSDIELEAPAKIARSIPRHEYAQRLDRLSPVPFVLTGDAEHIRRITNTMRGDHLPDTVTELIDPPSRPAHEVDEIMARACAGLDRVAALDRWNYRQKFQIGRALEMVKNQNPILRSALTDNWTPGHILGFDPNFGLCGWGWILHPSATLIASSFDLIKVYETATYSHGFNAHGQPVQLLMTQAGETSFERRDPAAKPIWRVQ